MSRIILHIDMNSYFASVEQQANPFLRGKPIGIAGKKSNSFKRSVVAAASIEAKAKGVKTAMSSYEAKKICPELILVSGDPEKYGEITNRFNTIFRRYASAVEQFSVDESFLDVTEYAEDYLGAIAIAQAIKHDLKKECGERITASIGIAPNKVIAKAASEQVKPDGLTSVRPDQVIPFLDSIELQDICGIGPRIERRLHKLGIQSFSQMREFPLADLEAEFKSYGTWLHRVSFGLDNGQVVDGGEDPKSVGHSYTLPKSAWSDEDVQRYLLGLCDKVAWRLRRDGFIARCIHVYIRYDDFGGDHQQKRFNEPTADGLKIYKMSWQLIKRWRDTSRGVRLVGISASQLIKSNEPQPLFIKGQKMVKVLPALDAIQSRYGSDSWTRASLLPVKFKARSSGFAYDHEL